MVAGEIVGINTTDYFANYIVGNKDKLEKINFGEIEQVPLDCVDYSIAPKEEYDILKSMTKKIPTNEELVKAEENHTIAVEDKSRKLSFLNCVNIEEGTEWYKKEFPEVPDELCEIMARWNWGDLSTLTKKQVKNEKKKKIRKEIKNSNKCKVERGNFTIKFD